MKTLLINGTTKQSNSASGYFARFLYLFLKGEKKMVKVRNKLDVPRIMNVIDEYDALVFVTPLYCDGVPSNVLYLMQALEKRCKETGKTFKVYVLCNSGFIEGRQSEALFKVYKNFCDRISSEWCGGLGIGGGVMLNVTKMVFFFATLVALGLFLYNGVKYGLWVSNDVTLFYLSIVVTALIFNAAAFAYMLSMCGSINHRRQHGIRFTRALVFAWLFALVADAGFVIVSMFRGGFWRGINRKL